MRTVPGRIMPASPKIRQRFCYSARLVAAPTTTAVSSSTTIASPAAEPAPAAVAVVITVSKSPVITARRPAPAVSPATAAEAKNETYDHADHDYRHYCKEHFHPNPPFTNFRNKSLFSRQEPRHYNLRCKKAGGGTRMRAGEDRILSRIIQRNYSQRCDEWTQRRSL